MDGPKNLTVDVDDPLQELFRQFVGEDVWTRAQIWESSFSSQASMPLSWHAQNCRVCRNKAVCSLALHLEVSHLFCELFMT